MILSLYITDVHHAFQLTSASELSRKMVCIKCLLFVELQAIVVRCCSFLYPFETSGSGDFSPALEVSVIDTKIEGLIARFMIIPFQYVLPYPCYFLLQVYT